MSAQAEYYMGSDLWINTGEEERTFNVRYMSSIDLITVTGWSDNNEVWIRYCNMLANIDSHLSNPEKELNLYFKLEMLNATSVKYLFKIIKRLNKAYLHGHMVRVYWSCDVEFNEEMVEIALDFEAMCDFPFNVAFA